MASNCLRFAKWIDAYNEKGNEIEDSWYNADGSLKIKSVFTYDDNGNETMESDYDADGSLKTKSVYTYEYDPKGNWTKKMESEEVTKFGETYLEPQSVTIRTITYYE
jgi:hypothetical protein